MKKGLFLVATTLLLATGASAQLTLGFKAGLALPSHSADLGTTWDGTSTTTNYGTFGKGIPVSLEAAYFFNENIGVQLDATYLLGLSVTANENTVAGSVAKDYSKTTQFRLSPQLVIKTEMGLYTRAGLVLPLLGKTTRYSDNESNSAFLGAKTRVEVEAKGKFSLGFIGAVGYQFGLSDKLSIFGEIEYVGLSIKRKTTEVTVFEINDVDQLANYTILTGNNALVDYDDVTTPGDNKSQGTKSPYHSLGFNIGVRFTIGG